MGLTYHYSFSAPRSTTAAQLTGFLKRVEKDVQKLGFAPTLVLEASFDTPDRLEFARRLTTGKAIEATFLKGHSPDRLRGVWHFDPAGSCRIAPESGVILVATDERGRECVFGFFRYPAHIKDSAGRTIAPTNLDGDWVFSDHVKTADARFRTIVAKFREAGYVASEHDEFSPVKSA